ncbi:replication protein, partial [Pseudomonas chlororaphis]
MSNVIPLRNTGGFTRMDNDLYEALIGADLSGRELRVALAIHRLTSGYNKEAVKVAALYIAKMMYGDDEKAASERANVSRAINSLIRQRVIFRDGGSRDPITFLPVNEWKIDHKSTVLKSTQCVEKTPSTVSKITHIKDINTNLTANAVVAAVASTGEELESEPEEQGASKSDQPAVAKAD